MDKYLIYMRSKLNRDTSKSVTPGTYMVYGVMGALFALALTVLFNALGLVEAESYQKVAKSQFGVFESPVMMMLLYCVFTPIVEEVVFRFVIYNSLNYAIKKDLWALMLSSSLFGIYHMNPVQGVYAFLMGVVICYCYRRSESIFVPIIVHASANLIALAYTIFFL